MRSYHFQRWCTDDFRLFGVFLCGAGLIVLVAGWGRIRLVGLALLILGALSWPIGGMLPHIVGPWLWPKTLNYIDDYVLVDGLDWTNSGEWPKTTLTAFDKEPWGEWRLVGFGANGSGRLKEAEFREMLAAQPVAKKAWDECVAEGECTTVPP